MGLGDDLGRDEISVGSDADGAEDADRHRPSLYRGSNTRRRHTIPIPVTANLPEPNFRPILRPNQDLSRTEQHPLGRIHNMADAEERTKTSIDTSQTRQPDDPSNLPANLSGARLRNRPSFNFGLLSRDSARRNLSPVIIHDNSGETQRPSTEIQTDSRQIHFLCPELGEGIEDGADGPGRPAVHRRRVVERRPGRVSHDAETSSGDRPIVYEEVSSDDSAETIRHGRSFLQGRNSRIPVRSHPRRVAPGDGASADAQAQEQSRTDNLDISRIHDDGGKDEYLATEESIRCSSIHASSNFPRYLERIIEGRHRGPVRGQRARPNPEWPSHAPSVTACDYAGIINAAAPELALRIKNLLTILTNTGIEAKTIATPISQKSSINRKTLRQLIKAGVVIAADDGAIVNTIVFLVPEPAKRRNRVIGWPIWANTKDYEWAHDIAEQADIVEIINDVHNAEYGATFDLKCSFFQVLLPEFANDAFVFELNGAKFKFTRLPMGYTASAEIMQLLTQTLAAEASKGTQVKWRVHVDNVLFYGSYSDVEMAIANMIEVGKKFQVTYSETPSAPQSKVLFHGVHLDFNEKTVEMAQKAKDKFKTFDQFFEEKLASPSHIIPLCINGGQLPLLKLLGTATFWARTMFAGSRFTAGSMSEHFQVMQIIRAVARAQWQNKTTFLMNRGALARIRSWMKSIPCEIKPPKLDHSDFIITTDACNTGGGFHIENVSSRTGLPKSFSRAYPWKTPANSSKMGVFELRSIAIALANSKITPSYPEGWRTATVDVFTDSTIAIGALKKGYSPSSDINAEVMRIFEICRQKRLCIHNISYVPTGENIADPLSRAVSKPSSILPTSWVWEDTQFTFMGEDVDLIICSNLTRSSLGEELCC